MIPVDSSLWVCTISKVEVMFPLLASKVEVNASANVSGAPSSCYTNSKI